MSTVDRIGHFRGLEFQRFCDVLLCADDPGHQAVDGRGGDNGCDGFRLTGDTIFQAYAPDTRTYRNVASKLDEAFAAVRQHFPEAKRFVFLTPFELTIEQHRHLRKTAEQSGLQAESWGESKLLAILAAHPEIKSVFPDLLLSDMIGMLKEIRDAVTEDNKTNVDYSYDPLLLPLQDKGEPRGKPHGAFEWFRVTVIASSLVRPGYEPEDEDAFVDKVKEYFLDDLGAQIEDNARAADRIPVENRGVDLCFHRKWCWYLRGAVAMAGTLPDLVRPGAYSVADMAVDVTQLLKMASALGDGKAFVRFGMNPYLLEAKFDPSDVRARALGVTLSGVEKVVRPRLESSEMQSWWMPVELAQLADGAHLIAGALIVPAMKNLHQARISMTKFQNSIPDVVAACLEARAR